MSENTNTLVTARHRPGMTTSPALQSHLDAIVRSWLGVGPDTAVPQLPPDLAARLMRDEEHVVRHRDQWGAWEASYSRSYRDGTILIPELDIWAADQRRAMRKSGPTEPLWPDGHEFVVCLTHDVEMPARRSTPGQVRRRLAKSIRRFPGEARSSSFVRLGRELARNAHWGVSTSPEADSSVGKSLAIERRHSVSASYFFTAASGAETAWDCVYAPQDRCRLDGRRLTVAELAREIRDEGFDIGLHGSYLSAVERSRLLSEKTELEAMIGSDVTTTRQHYLHFDIARTPALQEEAGLLADSTLGFNRHIGFRAGTSLPFRLFDGESRRPIDVLEVPLIIQESPLLSSSGLELSEELAVDTVAEVFDRVATVDGVATVLVHPHSLVNPVYERLYETMIEQAVERGAWVTSLAEIQKWWRDRETRLSALPRR
jgi:hypothetical protein